jgi:hypothetical protein
VLRVYFDNIDKHIEYIENASPAIKEIFTNDSGLCGHCSDRISKDFKCKIRKTYTLDGRTIEKCGCGAFMFTPPTLDMLPGYLALFDEFYPAKRGK